MYDANEIVSYFELQGFKITYDFDKKGNFWWEISKDKLRVQVDGGIPLRYILEDFKCFKQKKEPTSKYDYVINCGSQENFEEFLNNLDI